ncbi:MAG: hypothetical protein AABZ39_06235 [Spirochaetota bacterium]
MQKHYFAREDFYVITNAEEIAKDKDGIVPLRIKSAVCAELPLLTEYSRMATGMEIAFETNSKTIALTFEILASVRPKGSADISPIECIAGEMTTSGFHAAEFKRGMQRAVFTIRPSADEGIYRIVLAPGAIMRLHTLEIDDNAYLKKPFEYMVELSGRAGWLVYGPPIVSPATVRAFSATHAAIASRVMDLLPVTLDLGAFMFTEEAVVQYLATRSDWQMISIAIGPEVIAAFGTDVKKFHAAYERALRTLRAVHVRHPIICMTPFWSPLDRTGGIVEEYREAIRGTIKSRILADRDIYFIEGSSIIMGPRGLLDDGASTDAFGEMIYTEALIGVFREIAKKTNG